MKKRILQLAMENWSAWGLGTPPKELDCLLLNHVTANFVIFEKGAAQPRLLVKVSENQKLRQEHSNITYIHRLSPDAIPKPYGFHIVNGYFVLVEDFIIGKKIFTLRRKKQCIDRAFAALNVLHSTIRKDDFILDDDRFNKLLLEPVQEFTAYNKCAMLTKQCNRLLEKFENYKNILFPNIPQHGDFSFVNLLFTREGVKIIDWEDFGKTKLPLYDIFTLITSLYFDSRLFYNYTDSNSINTLFNRKIREYCMNFGIELKLVKLLYPISLLTFFNKNNPDRIEAIQTTEELIKYFFSIKTKFHFLYFD